MDDKKIKIKMGNVLKGYRVFPIIFGVIFLALTIILIFVDKKAALIAAIAFALYVIALVIFQLINNRKLMNGLVEFVNGYENVQNELISEFPIPYALLDYNGTIILSNSRFSKFYGGSAGEENIVELFKELKEDDLVFEGRENNISIVYDSRNFRLNIQKVKIPNELLQDSLFVVARKAGYLLAAYMFDETEIVNMMKQGVEQQMVIGSLYVDNYQDVIGNAQDVSKSLIIAQIDRTINDYFSRVEGVVTKIEKDRYFVVFKRKYLSQMQRNKFDILDEVKGLTPDEEMKFTISMGIGVGENYSKDYEYATLALELALGRGGDQVVVKEGERVYFYGGKTKQAEKNTRVKARVNALSLREIIKSHDHVVVMGHKMSDVDSFGAAIGIYKAAKSLGKRAHIVLNELNNAVQPVLERFMDLEEYAEGVFVSNDEAHKYVNKETVLVIVDVNKPDIFECPELVNMTNTVVLIDHHLQSGDRVDNLVLSYTEPTASSACEMVAEMLQYISDDVKLTKTEAEAMYAGILIDTDYFTKNTGVRTFEAAAYLRKSGIDVGMVNGLFRDSLEDVKIKAEAIRNAELIEEGYAYAVVNADESINPQIVAAKVANELLNAKGIKASFAMTDYNGKVFISARSIGDINVQLVMERMGGGGHMNIAGAQLKGSNIEDATKKLKLTVRKMIEEGDL